MRSICQVMTTSIMRSIDATIVSSMHLPQKIKESKSVQEENDLYYTVLIKNVKPFQCCKQIDM